MAWVCRAKRGRIARLIERADSAGPATLLTAAIARLAVPARECVARKGFPRERRFTGMAATLVCEIAFVIRHADHAPDHVGDPDEALTKGWLSDRCHRPPPFFDIDQDRDYPMLLDGPADM